MEAQKSVKTAQPIVGDMIRMWDDLLKTHDEVFYLPLSNALSGTNKTAITLAKNYEGKVTVVQSEFVCYPTVIMMQMVKEMIEKDILVRRSRKKLKQKENCWRY